MLFGVVVVVDGPLPLAPSPKREGEPEACVAIGQDASPGPPRRGEGSQRPGGGAPPTPATTLYALRCANLLRWLRRRFVVAEQRILAVLHRLLHFRIDRV